MDESKTSAIKSTQDMIILTKSEKTVWGLRGSREHHTECKKR